MIINLPTAETLNDVALRLYFSAWESLMTLKSDFDMFKSYNDDGDADRWSEEESDYLKACQPELQSICNIIQQSNEISLKAKLCDISPYILLMKNDSKFRIAPKEIDFSELKTLDAVELPGAVNTFCTQTLSNKFIDTYNLVRSLRNKIAHLGRSEKSFHPNELLRILVDQYIELWPARAWLYDRVLFASRTRASFFHDGKYTSTHMEVMHELPYCFEVLTGVKFKKLFGYPKTARRYLCHVCIDNADTRYADLDLDACRTAFLNGEGSRIHCVMCGEKYQVERKSCGTENCKCNVIGDNDDDFVGKCHMCGEHQAG